MFILLLSCNSGWEYDHYDHYDLIIKMSILEELLRYIDTLKSRHGMVARFFTCIHTDANPDAKADLYSLVLVQGRVYFL